MQLARIFFSGLFISFLGALPLGTLNIAAMQISAIDSIQEAIWFSIGALLVEMIYVRISLVAMDWVRKRRRIFRWLEWMAMLLVMALAIASFITASKPVGSKNIILGSAFPKFFLGMAMSAVNPVQIPFWFGWSTVLFAKKILLPQNEHYNMYIAGIGIGTFAGNAVFIFGGRYIGDKISDNHQILNWAIGGIFATTAIIMFWKMLMKKDASARL
jgi:threonine/homoserine/homoserine lactone efflux protein